MDTTENYFSKDAETAPDHYTIGFSWQVNTRNDKLYKRQTQAKQSSWKDTIPPLHIIDYRFNEIYKRRQWQIEDVAEHFPHFQSLCTSERSKKWKSWLNTS